MVKSKIYNRKIIRKKRKNANAPTMIFSYERANKKKKKDKKINLK